MDLAYRLKKELGAVVIAIDENEQLSLGQLLKLKYGNGSNNIDCITVIHNPGGIQGTNFSYTHEFAYFLYPNVSGYITKELRNSVSNPELTPFRDWGKENSKRTESPNCFFPIIVNKDNGEVVGFGEIPKNDYHPSNANEIYNDEIWVWPIDVNGVERRWRFARDTVESISNELVATQIKGVWNIQRAKMYFTRKTVWDDPKYSANVSGTQLLAQIMKTAFSFPKSLYLVKDCLRACDQKTEGIVLDYYAGSGTTGHAVIELNREDNGNRKFILVEMGEYFNSVTKPRMQKVVYAADWKDGKPQNRNTGVSQIIKYMRLESYEDALSNISLNDDVARGMVSLFDEEYLIHYMLDLESRDSLLDVEAFRDPFAYQMKITEKNECKTRPVDLVETFNYLIGLTVVRQGAVSYFAAKPSAEAAYEGAVDLVKDLGGEFAFRQIEGTLPDGRRALVIWRTVTDDVLKSNAALDAYFTKYRINPADREYDVIFVNGDSNLENLRTANESWKVQMTEIEFKRRMFEEA